MGLMFQNFSQNYLIIDGSYLMHYQAKAAYSWYQSSFKGDYPYDNTNCYKYNFMLDDEYLEMHESLFFKRVLKLCKKYDIPTSKIVLALDCPRADIWRKDYYPEYKLNRDKKRKLSEPNFKTVFEYTLNHLFPMAADKYGFKILSAPSAEGDDIIAVATKYIAQTHNPNHIYICANDMDISQLTAPNITIINIKDENLSEKMKKIYGSPKKVILYKMLSGDTGDNIPSIKYRKMGDKTAQAILDEPKLLYEFLEKYPDSKAQLALNTLLVSFDKIPQEIRDAILVECELKNI